MNGRPSSPVDHILLLYELPPESVGPAFIPVVVEQDSSYALTP